MNVFKESDFFYQLLIVLEVMCVGKKNYAHTIFSGNDKIYGSSASFV